MDLASARSLESGGDARNDTRLELCAPGLLQVETEERQFSGEPILVFTNNLSEHGVAVIARQPLQIGESQVAFAFWHEGPLYFLGCVRRCQHVGGGFWAIGLELSETISKTELQSLRVLAEKLSPETTWE